MSSLVLELDVHLASLFFCFLYLLIIFSTYFVIHSKFKISSSSLLYPSPGRIANPSCIRRSFPRDGPCLRFLSHGGISHRRVRGSRAPYRCVRNINGSRSSLTYLFRRSETRLTAVNSLVVLLPRKPLRISNIGFGNVIANIMSLRKCVRVGHYKLTKFWMNTCTCKRGLNVVHQTSRGRYLFTICPLSVCLKVHFVFNLVQNFSTILDASRVFKSATVNTAHIILLNRMCCIVSW